MVLLTGIFSEILGFDKYTDITTEHAIRGAFCDLALRINGNIAIIVQAKAIGIELKDPHGGSCAAGSSGFGFARVHCDACKQDCVVAFS